jgi:hypothetical protein
MFTPGRSARNLSLFGASAVTRASGTAPDSFRPMAASSRDASAAVTVAGARKLLVIFCRVSQAGFGSMADTLRAAFRSVGDDVPD